jgi:hypothetical protein
LALGKEIWRLEKGRDKGELEIEGWGGSTKTDVSLQIYYSPLRTVAAAEAVELTPAAATTVLCLQWDKPAK